MPTRTAAPPVDQSFDLYARMVCRALRVPCSLVTFVHGDRLVIPGAVGLPASVDHVREAPLDQSLCQFVVGGGDPVLIDDVSVEDRDPVPSIEAEMGLRSYAGWPLTGHEGQVIGSLCAIDVVPRHWTPGETAALGDVAASCSAEIAQRELRRLAVADEADARASAESGRLLLALSEALMRTTTLTDIAVAVDQFVLLHLGCQRAAMWLHSPHSEEGEGAGLGCLELIRTPGYPGSVESPYDALEVTGGHPLGEAFMTQRARFFADRAEQDARYSAFTARASFGQGRAFLPLTLVDQPLGVLALGWPEAHPIGTVDRATLAALTSYTAQAVHRATLLRERMHTSLTLQRAMLTELPTPPGLQLVARYRPASTTEQVGGDWYDALVLPGGQTEVACGDVVGHDIEAAAAMGQVRSALRAFAWAVDDGPAHTVRRLDEALTGLGIDVMATLVLARIDRTDDPSLPWSVTWTSAGHPPPVLLGPDGRVRALVPVDQDTLLGVVPDESRHDERVALASGSTLLLFTDGLVERRGEALDAGLARLGAELAGRHEADLDRLVNRVLAAMLPDDLDDDVAVLAVRFGAG